ncbi:MAG: class I SAM-dependent methyltransferase [Myxococcota bacterium]
MDSRNLDEALARREPLVDALQAEGTDCYRLFHGAVEGHPGLTIDRYGPVLLVQTWRTPVPVDAVHAWADRVSDHLGVGLTPVHNHRAKPIDFERHWPHADASPVDGHEGGLVYDVRPRHDGQDPLLFLDLRSVRRRVRAESAGRSVLNLFAYTCGVGLAAAAGQATEVWNVDFAKRALQIGEANATRNGLPQRFVQENVFVVTRQLAGLSVGRRGRYTRYAPRTFDLVILDPPRWSTSRAGTVDTVRDYPSLFKPAVLATAPGGVVVATNNVASVDREAWFEILRRCAAKAGRPLVDLEWMPPDEDFPSPDGQPPLKVAWCRLGA